LTLLNTATPRWADYVFRTDSEVEHVLVAAASAAGECLLVVGEGFDPRGAIGPQAVAQALTGKPIHVAALGLPPGPIDDLTAGLVRENRRALDAIAAKTGNSLRRLAFPESSRRGAGLALSHRLASEVERFKAGLIVVDVSTLPSSVGFPVIASILAAHGEGLFLGELVVLVAENAELDQAIREEGADDPGALGGFHFDLDEAGTRRIRTWVPLLGENQAEQLQAIHRELQPDEIIPILPFPAANPRRADALVNELRTLLFEEMRVEPANLLYADEANPFDVYRSVCRLSERYLQTFSSLGGSTMIASVHGSKLLGLGVLLAAWEHRLPVLSSVSTGYAFDVAEGRLPALLERTKLAALWLLGEPYR